jgi:chemotaxis protein MotB
MARKKQEDPPKGGAGWLATFGDLMNLLLCFFVLLFSMSSVDAQKFEMMVASLQSSFSVLSGGGSSVGDGQMVSSGVSQLQMLDVYYNKAANSSGDAEGGETDAEGEGSEDSLEEAKEAVEQEGLKESEEMSEQIEDQSVLYGIQDQVEVSFNAEYVLITLNGAVLFDSGKAEIKEDALPLIDKIGKILNTFDQNIIDVEGHTDNVPIHNSKYESNDVLSMYRALSVADYIRANTTLEASHIKSSGRGEYVPIADNTTAEGRAMNRRVEIKVYNSANSEID